MASVLAASQRNFWEYIQQSLAFTRGKMTTDASNVQFKAAKLRNDCKPRAVRSQDQADEPACLPVLAPPNKDARSMKTIVVPSARPSKVRATGI